MTERHEGDFALADQTGDGMEFVADLRDIAAPHPERRRLTDPVTAAYTFKHETMSRVSAVLQAHPGTPVVFLSGGVDSILVAAAAVALGVRPHAITVVTDGGTDETNAVAAATALGLTHEVVSLRDEDVV